MLNKIVLITGATDGFGKAAALELAKLGATVVIGCRTKETGKRALSEISKKSGSNKLDLFVADLSSFAQVKHAASLFKKKYKKLDVLINNAGLYSPSRVETDDGFEMTFQVVYLSHFLLTHLLLDLLKRSSLSRIINVASKHNGIKINFDDLLWEHKYSPFMALGQTMLSRILFTKTLAKYLHGSGVTVNSLHPAVVQTGLGVYHSGGPISILFTFLKPFMRTTIAEGAATHVYLASSPEVEGISGEFFIKNKITPTSANANNDEDAKRLWDVSLKLTHIKKF